ncbi:MAG: hypothetical protein WA432_04600 [Candidatus Babeliaceae bacterium]
MFRKLYLLLALFSALSLSLKADSESLMGDTLLEIFTEKEQIQEFFTFLEPVEQEDFRAMVSEIVEITNQLQMDLQGLMNHCAVLDQLGDFLMGNYSEFSLNFSSDILFLSDTERETRILAQLKDFFEKINLRDFYGSLSVEQQDQLDSFIDEVIMTMADGWNKAVNCSTGYPQLLNKISAFLQEKPISFELDIQFQNIS